MRQTVGGAQSVVDAVLREQRERARGRRTARPPGTKTEAPAFHGAKKRAPGVLGPSGRADVAVPVALAHADPVHRREVAHRVARVRVEDHLRPRRRAGGEVEQEGIAGARRRRRAGSRAGSRCASSQASQPGARPPTRMRMQSPATAASVATPASSVTTQRILPRAMRSPRSAAVSSVDAGLTTAPSFMAASVISQSGVDVAAASRGCDRRADSPARRRNDAPRGRTAPRAPRTSSARAARRPATTHSASRPLPRASTSK